MIDALAVTTLALALLIEALKLGVFAFFALLVGAVLGRPG